MYVGRQVSIDKNETCYCSLESERSYQIWQSEIVGAGLKVYTVR